MSLYKVLCTIVLCFICDGATAGVGDRCGFMGYSGTCVEKCPPTQLIRTLDGQIEPCYVRGKKRVVCCLDPIYYGFPLIPNLNFIANFYFSGIPNGTTVSNDRPTYSTGSVNWAPPTNNILPDRPASTILYPTWPSTTTPSWTTPSTTPSTTPNWFHISTTPRWTTPSTTTTTTGRPVATTPRMGPTTTEYTPRVYDYVTNQPIFEGCRDLDPKLTTNKTGRVAWDSKNTNTLLGCHYTQCLDYQQLVYPCQRSAALLGNMVRMNHCSHPITRSDEEAFPNEYPHLVVLGVRSIPDGPLRWECTGTLISEQFVLTSAHCWYHWNERDTLYAIVGTLQRIAGNKDAYQEHRIESFTFYGPYKYKGYAQGQYGYEYHDIALLKTATNVRLSQWTIPACLDVYGKYPRAVATRWHAQSWSHANRVQKVFLHQLNKSEYQKKFDSSLRRRTYPIANQMGYESKGNSNDNCKYDNEASLTVENQRIHCMYTVIGVSSNVKATCGPSPASSFTKVVDYTSWIERIVWPEENSKS